MDLLSSLNIPTPIIYILVTAAVCLLVGYFFGNRRNKQLRRNLQREHNEQNLALLEAKSKYERVRRVAAQQARKDRLLALTLKRLKSANLRVEELTATVHSQEKRHFMNESRLRMNVVDSNEKAIKAAGIARQAMMHLKKAKHNSSSAESNPSTKQYTTIVDQNSVETRRTAISRATTHDSSRLNGVHSSNEVVPPSPA